MKKRSDGGAAFPQFDVVAGERDGHGDVIDAYTTATGGMSLRDWFAGQIASGMAAYSGTSGVSYGPGDIAGRSYEIADAMLKARAREAHDA